MKSNVPLKSIIFEPFESLQNTTFARLYFAQIASLFGDAFTWLGLAQLTYEISPDNTAAILASALTLRVTAYIIFSPFAGVLSKKMQRKTYTTHHTVGQNGHRMFAAFCYPRVAFV
jgi:MFS transporter, NRE family, putaive nickel resistance protein